MQRLCLAAVALLFGVLCAGADEKKDAWQDRLEKYRLTKVEEHKLDVKHWELKEFDAKENAKASAKKGQRAEAAKYTQQAKDFAAERDRSAKALKEAEAKNWTPPAQDLRKLRAGEFTYFRGASVKVIQALDAGTLVEYGRETFYMKGLTGVADGKDYDLTGFIECTGTYKYTAVSGAGRSVVALELHSK
jgi:hypothetical protein